MVYVLIVSNVASLKPFFLAPLLRFWVGWGSLTPFSQISIYSNRQNPLTTITATLEKNILGLTLADSLSARPIEPPSFGFTADQQSRGVRAVILSWQNFARWGAHLGYYRSELFVWPQENLFKYSLLLTHFTATTFMAETGAVQRLYGVLERRPGSILNFLLSDKSFFRSVVNVFPNSLAHIQALTWVHRKGLFSVALIPYSHNLSLSTFPVFSFTASLSLQFFFLGVIRVLYCSKE